MFFRGSRYEHIQDAEFVDARGRVTRYKRMRFIPETEGRLVDIVREGDRPDLLAYRALGDPEQFWALCDVNREMRPVDLTITPGRRVTLPGPGTTGNGR